MSVLVGNNNKDICLYCCTNFKSLLFKIIFVYGIIHNPHRGESSSSLLPLLIEVFWFLRGEAMNQGLVLLIFLPYGLSFILLGVIGSFIRSAGDSPLRLVKALPWLVRFALTHGVAEWITLYRLISFPDNVFGSLDIIVVCFNFFSFVFLLLFGGRLVSGTLREKVFRNFTGLNLCLLLFGTYVVAVFLSLGGGHPAYWESWREPATLVRVADLLIRRFIAFPGALLAALGLWMEAVSFRSGGGSFLTGYFRRLAVLLFLYGIVAGIFISSSPGGRSFAHIPMEIYRTVFAAGLCFQMVLIGKEIQKLRLNRILALREVELTQKEREKLGQNLHDRVIQLLFSAALRLDTIEDLPDAETVIKEATDTASLIRGAIGEIRSFIALNHTDSVSLDTFSTIMMEACESLQRTHGIVVDVQFDFPAMVPPDQVVEEPGEIVSILYEAATNTKKHASGSSFSVKIMGKAGLLFISMSDQGPGFNPVNVRAGMGLESMKLRAQRAGARLIINSTKGTSINLELPLTSTRGKEKSEY